MAQQSQISIKHLKIDKANTLTITTVAIAAFIVVFSIVSAKVLLSQFAYQNRVISAKRNTVNQLKGDVDNISKLLNSYKAFVSTPQNVLGGNPNGTGQNDGNNAKIVLDALPSKYDFPGMITGFNAMLSNQNFSLESLGGTDEQLSVQNQQSSSSPSPQQIIFDMTVSGNYSAIQNAVSIMQRSIRPIGITNIAFSGTDNKMTASINAYTYWQPEKEFSFSSEVVK